MTGYLPEIIAHGQPDQWRCELELFVPATLIHFAGHFPGLPILPGVVQVDWAIRWGRECFDIPGEFLALDNLKFQNMVFPDTRLCLVLTWNPEKSQLSFSYSKEEGEKKMVSSGRFGFAGVPA